MIKLNKYLKSIIFIVLILSILIIGIFIKNIFIKNDNIDKLDITTQKSIESEIQKIIDDVQQENSNATIIDLKNYLLKIGYNLNTDTGELIYNNCIVSINNDLTISGIKNLSTVDYYLATNDEYLNVTFIVTNENGIEELLLPDTIIKCNNKTQVAIDRTFREGDDIFRFDVKIAGQNSLEKYAYIPTKKPIINTLSINKKAIRLMDIDFPETENLLKYYSIDEGKIWNEYIEASEISKDTVQTVLAKVVLNDNVITINKPERKEVIWKVYLYNLGNTASNITGGYTFRVLQNKRGSYENNSNNMYIYANSIYGAGYGEVELYTNNTINLSDYNTAYFDMDYTVQFGQEAWRCHFYYGFTNGKIIDIPGTNYSSGKIIPMDISQLHGSYRLYFKVYGASADRIVSCRIRSIYLE